ncbi:hypothetical protein DUNSADRAFT_8181 [Dunaliella salina]|uniref:Uncharacterized protein n=1 Tax=Dunaliella salina TaxID=3046 RepID=A0ABQ7GK35_DUNSA|nr:hypothetical protein DUNSADRAFT_8181 [Dunaliella salina]|eukprot:KAF5834910.1 hypothetical protein DUNSADRAFT_8181 [Dunaliella salina]
MLKGTWNAAVLLVCLVAVITCGALLCMKPIGKRLARWLIQQMQELEHEQHGRLDTLGMRPSAAPGFNGMAKAIFSGESGKPEGLPAPPFPKALPTNADGCQKQDAFDPRPRTGYLEWDDYFMALAFLSAQRSKDPSKQVGQVFEAVRCVTHACRGTQS